MRTLIIEDDHVCQKLMAEVLAQLPLEITACPDAESGLKAYLEKPYHLIILDLILPGMDGTEFCKRIRSLPNGKKCMIIAITGGEEARYFQSALDAGVDDYLFKPVVPDFLLLRLRIAYHLIVERKRNAELLRESEETAKVILNASPDQIFLLDPEGIILDCNETFAGLFNKSACKLIGSSVWSLFRSDETERYQAFHHGIVQSGKPLKMEIQENQSWIDVSATPIFNEAGDVIKIAIFVHDISEHQKAKEDLLKAKNEAEAASRAKTEFLANMNHEINTPLNAISGFTQLLFNQSGNLNLPPRFNQYLETIREASQNLAEIMANILDLARLETGELTVSEDELNLKQLFQGMFHVFRKKARRKNLDYTYQFDSKLPLIIRSDRTLLNQILLNLTDNAIKFTPEGQTVQLKAKKDCDTLVFEVIDQGIGISEQQQGLIFEMFCQADSSSTRSHGGIGAGLSLTKHMIDLLGGTIQIRSSPGRGSEFVVRLPLVPVSRQDSAAERYPMNIQFAKNNIVLVVEDNPINLRMIEAVVEDMGLQIHAATNGQEGVEKTRELQAEGHPPDIILMDMFMPVMDGPEAIRLIHRLPECSKIPVVVLSADPSSEREKEAKQAGACAYVTKPVDFQKLIPLLSRYLRKDHRTDLHSQSNRLRPTIPDEVKRKLEEGFNDLSRISIIETEKLVDQINRMLALCEGYDSPHFNCLKQLEDPAFNADEAEFNRLLHEALSNGDF